jgi:hypothetical protein
MFGPVEGLTPQCLGCVAQEARVSVAQAYPGRGLVEGEYDIVGPQAEWRRRAEFFEMLEIAHVNRHSYEETCALTRPRTAEDTGRGARPY